jgi:hypothetical protein
MFVIAFTVLIVTSSLFTVAFADVSVGVKKGDWIEYQVKVTGDPPPIYNITWARIDVTGVQGEIISLYVQTRFANGTLLIENVTLNLATGAIGDDFIIPIHLNPGDNFYDEYQGNITITSLQQRTAAGAERTVVSGATAQTSYYWDRETGFLISAISSESGYTMHTSTSNTNLWQPQILGLNSSLFYAIVVTIVVALVVAVAFLVWYKKMHS